MFDYWESFGIRVSELRALLGALNFLANAIMRAS